MLSPTTIQLLARLREEEILREAHARGLAREARARAATGEFRAPTGEAHPAPLARARTAVRSVEQLLRNGRRAAAPAPRTEPCAC